MNISKVVAFEFSTEPTQSTLSKNDKFVDFELVNHSDVNPYPCPCGSAWSLSWSLSFRVQSLLTSLVNPKQRKQNSLSIGDFFWMLSSLEREYADRWWRENAIGLTIQGPLTLRNGKNTVTLFPKTTNANALKDPIPFRSFKFIIRYELCEFLSRNWVNSHVPRVPPYAFNNTKLIN